MPNQTNAANGQLHDSFVVCQGGQGLELRGNLLKVTRFSVVFEIYSLNSVLRTSEVLQDFKIIFNDRTLYSGRAVVRNLINTGPALVCEATLAEKAWVENGFIHSNDQPATLREEYSGFIQEWQKLYKVLPAYKLAVSDMQTYFTDLRLWLEQLELGIRSAPAGDHWALEQKAALELWHSAKPALGMLFERFEETAQAVEKDLQPAHQVFAKRQLHPLILCSPFFHRCYAKPLGYAGDYEMVNMMLRNPCEGSSLFAKVMNLWFLDQPPVVAHRNRIDYLVGQLTQFTARMARQNRPARILSVGCGPAQEVQRFLAESEIHSRAQFTMLDFNAETLEYNRSIMNDLKSKHDRPTEFHYIKKSVHHMLKEGGRAAEFPAQTQYDFVYCAGLFDYLSDNVCERLMSIMHDWVSPGGLLVATNVASCNPSRGWMEQVVDWHLIYRNARQMGGLVPPQADPEAARIIAEPSGVNIFVEIEKPENG